MLLTEVMKKNRKLQHLDLTSTNLPSQVIIYLCDRLRKSRSILSAHFSDNPGLQDEFIEQTIARIMKCKENVPRNTIHVNRQIDFAWNSKMMERLQR